MKLPAATTAALCGALLSFTVPLTAQKVIAVKAGRLIPISGPELKDAVVLIEDGRIRSVGQGIEVPWDAKVIDASKQVVMPTYVVAHTWQGMSSGNENMANVPFLTVQDAIDPSSSFFEEALRNGIGTVHVIPGNRTLIGGQGMIVKPFGKTIEEMAVRSSTGIKMSLSASGGSRMAQIHKMRRALEDVQTYIEDYERRKKEFEQEKAAGATEDKEFKDKIDDKKKPVVDLLKGESTAWLYVPSAAEVFEALNLVKKYKIKVVLVLGPQVHKAARLLAKAKLPLVLDDTLTYEENDPETEELVEHCPAQLLAEAGAEFAISLGNVSRGGAGMRHYPWWQMATLIRNGIDRDTALKSLTIVPARQLGIAKNFGSIEAGKVANLQILNGDPLQATSWVQTVLLDGEVVYERDKDQRLQHLFGKTSGDSAAK